jgi:DNA-binding NarL/FixJ family response regulator
LGSIGVKAYINKIRYKELGGDLYNLLGISQPNSTFNLKPLTIDEIKLIELVVIGKTNAEIANEFNTVEKNIEYRLKKLCDRLSVPNSKLKIVEFAVRYGYI